MLRKRRKKCAMIKCTFSFFFRPHCPPVFFLSLLCVVTLVWLLNNNNTMNKFLFGWFSFFIHRSRRVDFHISSSINKFYDDDCIWKKIMFFFSSSLVVKKIRKVEKNKIKCIRQADVSHSSIWWITHKKKYISFGYLRNSFGVLNRVNERSTLLHSLKMCVKISFLKNLYTNNNNIMLVLAYFYVLILPAKTIYMSVSIIFIWGDETIYLISIQRICGALLDRSAVNAQNNFIFAEIIKIFIAKRKTKKGFSIFALSLDRLAFSLLMIQCSLFLSITLLLAIVFLHLSGFLMVCILSNSLQRKYAPFHVFHFTITWCLLQCFITFNLHYEMLNINGEAFDIIQRMSKSRRNKTSFNNDEDTIE